MAVRIEAHAEPIPGYKLLDRLGAGGFGEVWRAEAPGGIYKAIKIIHGDLRSKNSDLVRYAEQELKSLKRVKQVRHPYMLALDRYDIVDGRLMITMELADCNLWDRFREHRDRGLPGIPRDELLVYMAEIAEVLDLFNDQFQLQHLDIKPQNLFLLYNHAKVADFGQVKDLQGLLAEVTGGITPVYAAPETFDGVITRYCDQYSLACVYQELLTGVRPFDGGSLSQLLMQHLNLPPNLAPSPHHDRPALARALAKKPEDRWPTVTALVRSLAGGSQVSGRFGPPPSRVSVEVQTPHTAEAAPPPAAPAEYPPALAGSLPPLVAPGDTPPPKETLETTGPVFTPAPPETTGPGPLRPVLVIGLGETGLRVVQRLRFDLNERYGPPEATPAVRTLYVDTDPEALEDALRPRPADRLARLRAEDVFAAKLNRPAHYIKPRLSGRSLTEGWLDPQLLYKIPRTQQTMGVRLFGRLAFCDHYRPLMGKVSSELDAALAPEALEKTEARTGLRRRTNRPRVYVVAGLGGGTGGGMFLDVAYSVRTRLRRLGYEEPEVVGVLVLPPADPAFTPPQALGNTYAALTELNHYSRPDATFAATYDDRNGTVRETAPPFTRCFLVPGSAVPVATAAPQGSGVIAQPRSCTPANIPVPAARGGSGAVAKPGSRLMPALNAARVADPPTSQAVNKPFADAASLIRIHLFTPIGRLADEILPAHPESSGEPARQRPKVGLTAFGLGGYEWPRAEVVARTAARVGQSVLKRWTAADQKRAWEVMPGIAEERWAKLGLAPETILGQLQKAADLAAGVGIEDAVAQITNQLVPRGWLARMPEPGHVTLAIDQLVKLLGPPVASLKRPQSPVELAVSETAVEIAAGLALDVRTLIPVLADDPQYRLSGAEDLLNLFLNSTARLIEQHFAAALELDARAQAGFECVSQLAHFQKGMRKPTAAEFGEAIKQYPRARFQGLLSRALVGVYQSLREVFAGQFNDISNARQRLDLATSLPPPLPTFPETPPGPHRLLPPGCTCVADVVERFRKVITDKDLTDIDFRVQEVLEPELDGVFQACLNLTAGPERVVAAVYEVTRSHLDRRLGEVDLSAMLAERYRSPQHVERALEQTFQDAEPLWVGNGPWAEGEVAVVACPGGPGGERLRELVLRTIPVARLPFADAADELVVYREWPDVPLAALPHLGPAGAAAFQALQESQQCTPHTRLDVTRWADPDAK